MSHIITFYFHIQSPQKDKKIIATNNPILSLHHHSHSIIINIRTCHEKSPHTKLIITIFTTFKTLSLYDTSPCLGAHQNISQNKLLQQTCETFSLILITLT